ncbi:anti-sigma factor family protein [Ralstonia sp. 25C]|uniref:anti-sigma factor family protein n=1 Tax=Ralstonia sp. 25C TaxID=3447363 RepID=UPI003F74D933
MNEFTHDDRVHLRVWELLPWVVNQSASASEQTEVDEHLRHCEACRAELALQQELNASINAGGALVSPGVEEGLARLSDRIDAPQRSPRPRLLAVAYGLAALVLLQSGGLAVLGMKLGGGDTATYRTLSSPARMADHATIRLVVDPSTSVVRLQQLLVPLGLQIVAGPSESGVYTLGARAAEAGRPALNADTHRQIEALRAAPEVRFVEPIAGADEGT